MKFVKATKQAHRILTDLGCNYPKPAIALAIISGWTAADHINALLRRDEDGITITHPINWLTEEEAERYFT